MAQVNDAAPGPSLWEKPKQVWQLEVNACSDKLWLFCFILLHYESYCQTFDKYNRITTTRPTLLIYKYYRSHRITVNLALPALSVKKESLQRAIKMHKTECCYRIRTINGGRRQIFSSNWKKDFCLENHHHRHKTNGRKRKVTEKITRKTELQA